MAQEGQLRTLSLALECPWLTQNEPLAIGHDNQILHTQASISRSPPLCNVFDVIGYSESETIASLPSNQGQLNTLHG
jgi:hypothetical protein